MEIRRSVVAALLRGLVVLVPIYVTGLLLLKAASSFAGFIRPIANLLPDWIPAAQLLSLLLVVALCLLVGLSVNTRPGRTVWKGIQQSAMQRVPGYASIQNLTQQLAGESHTTAWKPALVEIEEALVPAFIIEELEDGHVTVFVPSVPTPLAGAVYILTPERVHAVDVPFKQAIKAVSQWGAGSQKLVAAMRKSEACDGREKAIRSHV
jgi:uncharacterized membrane protein